MFGLLFIILCIGCVFIYHAAKRQSIKIKNRDGALHSLPKYYGYYASLWFLAPSIVIIVLYLLFADSFITSNLVTTLPDDIKSLPENELVLILNDIKNLALGNMANNS